MYKKNILVILIWVLWLGCSFEVNAEPKQMPDGTVFDAQFYADTYPDVKAAYGNDEVALYNHYVTCGKKEGRKATNEINIIEFDAEYYAKNNPDVVAIYGNSEEALYKHYVEFGKKEGRKAKAGYVENIEIFSNPGMAVGNGELELIAILNNDPDNKCVYAPDIKYISDDVCILQVGKVISSKYIYGQWSNGINTLTCHALWDVRDYNPKTKINGLYKFGSIIAYQWVDDDTYVLLTSKGGGFRTEISKGEAYIYSYPVDYMANYYAGFSENNWIYF